MNTVPHPVLDEARQLLRDYRAREDGGDGNVVHLPDALLPELHRVSALSCSGEMLQIVPFHADGWEPEAFEHLVWRQIAARQKVRRVYVVPHRGIAYELLERQLRLDMDAGIDARVAFVSALPEDMQGPGIGALWVLDGQVVVSAGVPAQLTVSRRAVDLNASLEAWETVLEVSETADVLGNRDFDLEEPLVLSADLVSSVADVLCVGDHVSPDGCCWYHAAWQYLRLMDMVSTPTWHSDFYRRSLREALRARPDAQTLITGTADYSMFAYVDMAAKACNASPQVTAVDLCATPLFACRWYAKRVDRHLTTISEDIMAFGRSELQRESWDLIVTDAFLTRFSAEEIAGVVGVWRELLRPGGELVTTVRIHSHTPQGRDEDSAIRDFALCARKRSERWQPFLARSQDEIAALAEIYAQRMMSTHIGSEAEIRQIVTNIGFDIHNERLAEVPGELHPTTYLELVCIRNDAD
jgi:SAM-dependent methyltransferase